MLDTLLNTPEDKTDQINLLAQSDPNGWNSLMTTLHCHPKYAKTLLKILNTFDPQDKANILKQCSRGGWNALLIALFSTTNQINPLLKQIISLKDEKIRKEILGQVISSNGWGLKEAIKENRVNKELVDLINKIELQEKNQTETPYLVNQKRTSRIRIIHPTEQLFKWNFVESGIMKSLVAN